MSLNYLLNEYKGNNAKSFPDPDKDPKEKNEKSYILECLKAMYSAHSREKTGITPTRQDKFNLNRLYGKGDQPKEYYEKVLITSSGTGTTNIEGSRELAEQRRKSWQNLDFDHKVSYAPKVEDYFWATFLDIEKDVIGTPIDKDSGQQMKTKKLRMISQFKFYDELKEMRKLTRQKEPNWDFFPVDKGELDMFEVNGGFKLNFAKAIEKLVKHTFSESGWGRLKKHYVSDVINTGYAIGKISENKDTGETTVDYTDPEYFIVQHSNYWDYRDIEFAGELKPWTVSDLVKWGVEEEEIKDVISKYAGILGNPGSGYFRNKGTSITIEDMGHFKVPVFEGYYLDYEDEYKKEYVNPYKKKRLIDVPYGRKPKNNNEKIRKTRKWYVYKGKWIVGSDILFDYGKERNILKEGKEPVLPYGVFKLTDTTITERLIPLYDQLEIGWLKFQNAQSQAAASGNAINMRLLANVEFGGHPIHPVEALKFMKETGDLIYSDTDMGTDRGRYFGGEVKPVHPIEGGMRRDLEEGIEKFEWTVRMIEYITGMSDVAMGSQPSGQGEQRVGITEMTVNASQNIIQPNFDAIIALKGKLAKNAMLDIQVKLKHDKQMQEYYSGIIGDKDVQAIVLAGKRGAKMGIHFEPRPTRQQRMDLYGMIEKAIGAKILSFDEALMIKQSLMTGANLKDLSMKISYKIRKREQELTRKEFAARKQQHQQNMEYNQQQFKQEMAKQMQEDNTKLKEQAIKQKGETERNREDINSELKQLVMRLRGDEQKLISEERQKNAELNRS